jgi:hypothetical protein
LARQRVRGGNPTGKAAAAGLGHQSGAEEPPADRGATTGGGGGDEERTRDGGGFATNDVREDAEHADGGGVSANPVGGLGRDTGSAAEGGPGTEGGLGSD